MHDVYRWSGTTFHVFLPAVQVNALTTRDGTSIDSVATRTETILLVEDDESVRKLTALTLRSLGYTLVEAGDGLEALALVQSRSLLKIDLLVTDVVMPNISGRELTQRLISLRPEIKCLLMSGHTDDALIHRGALDTQTLFLQKPFTPQQLGRRIREILDNSVASP